MHWTHLILTINTSTIGSRLHPSEENAMQLLDPSALLEQLPRLLPSTASTSDGHSGASDEASTSTAATLRSPQEALAALTHTVLTRLSFRLTSILDAAGGEHIAVESFPENRLPPAWRQHGPGSFTFRYAHDQSSLHFLVKIVSLGPRLLIHATALELSKTESYEVEVDRFTSRSFWPWSLGSSSEPLVNGFVSSTRIADFVFGAQVKLIQKLVPGLRKDGYQEVDENDQGSTSSTSQTQPSSSSSSSDRQPPPARPFVPDDGYPDATDPRLPPFRNPLVIGDRDLDPLGRGGFGAPPPLFGGGNPGRFPGGDDGGGMIVGPNHPMFRDRFNRDGTLGGGGLGGGMVPPGARFDPVTPFGGPNQGPFRPGGPGAPRRPGPRRPGLGDPDWDEMPPPGNNSDYDNMFM